LGEAVADARRALAVKRRLGGMPEPLALFDNLTARDRLVHQGSMEELRREGSLEDKFLAVVGHEPSEAQKLSWVEG
jgi:ABC-type Na+ transport system ATPase subunit NatA